MVLPSRGAQLYCRFALAHPRRHRAPGQIRRADDAAAEKHDPVPGAPIRHPAPDPGSQNARRAGHHGHAADLGMGHSQSLKHIHRQKSAGEILGKAPDRQENHDLPIGQILQRPLQIPQTQGLHGGAGHFLHAAQKILIHTGQHTAGAIQHQISGSRPARLREAIQLPAQSQRNGRIQQGRQDILRSKEPAPAILRRQLHGPLIQSRGDKARHQESQQVQHKSRRQSGSLSLQQEGQQARQTHAHTEGEAANADRHFPMPQPFKQQR